MKRNPANPFSISQLKAYYRRVKAKFPMQDGIRFIHHKPDRGNVGDYLCSPRHYFRFYGAQDELTIIGGGVFVEFGYRMLNRLKYDKSNCVLWGAGLSIRDESDIVPVETLDYMTWGLRDVDRVADPNRFLPCVSCLNPMLDEDAASEGVLLFLNADPKVTSKEELDAIRLHCEQKNWSFLLNNCSPEEISTALLNHTQVITNSFHGGYWGLLSGKKVSILGYSSKFKSLLKGVGADSDKLIKIGRGAGDLLSALKDDTSLERGQRIDHPQDVLQRFRKLNIDFANSLIDLQAIEHFKIEFNPS